MTQDAVGSTAKQRFLPPEHPASAAYQARRKDAAAAAAAAEAMASSDGSAQQAAASPAASGVLEDLAAGTAKETARDMAADAAVVDEVTPVQAAVAWYSRAAALNCTEAMWYLAWMHQHGLGVPKDMRRAEALVRRWVCRGG